MTNVISLPQTIEIEKLVYGGDGLGRLPSGEVLFVPWSAPGDQLRIRRQPDTKPARALIENIVTPGPARTQPACSVFGTCGGCQWQHIQPASQRDWKQKIVQESLERIGKLRNIEVLPTLGSDEASWHYRNRVQWEVEPEGDEWGLQTRYRLGYHQANSHAVVPFEHCWIIPENLNHLANGLQTYLAENPDAASGLLRIEVAVNAEEQILLRFIGENTPALSTIASTVSESFPQIVGIVHADADDKKQSVLFGQDWLHETLDGQKFKVSAGSFFQTNHHAAEKMLTLLGQWLQQDTHSLLDIYAGVGVFAIHLKERTKRIVVIESSPSALADAKENIRNHQADHIELTPGDARMVLRNLKEDFDAAIIDPPRAGCHADVLAWLSAHVKKQLLYVSCNPTTLARDLKTLSDNGWQVQAVQPLDMFPQTYHIETIVNLTR